MGSKKKIVPNTCWWLPSLLAMQPYRWKLNVCMVYGVRYQMDPLCPHSRVGWLIVSRVPIFILAHETVHKKVWWNSELWPPETAKGNSSWVYFFLEGTMSSYKMAVPISFALTMQSEARSLNMHLFWAGLYVICDGLWWFFESWEVVLLAKKIDVQFPTLTSLPTHSSWDNGETSWTCYGTRFPSSQ